MKIGRRKEGSVEKQRSGQNGAKKVNMDDEALIAYAFHCPFRSFPYT